MLFRSVSSAYPRLLIFLPAILILACVALTSGENPLRAHLQGSSLLCSSQMTPLSLDPVRCLLIPGTGSSSPPAVGFFPQAHPTLPGARGHPSFGHYQVPSPTALGLSFSSSAASWGPPGRAGLTARREPIPSLCGGVPITSGQETLTPPRR